MDKRNSNISYVYRHTKLGTSEVFYIGIGSQPNYGRAYTKKRRNKHWKSVVNKYGYEVEILSHNLTWGEACELETTLIAYYKRKDCCGGTLVNMTDGGDGAHGVIVDKEVYNKRSLKLLREGNLNSKKVIDTETLIIYNSIKEVSELFFINMGTLQGYLSGSSPNKTNFALLSNYKEGMKIIKSTEVIKVKVIDTVTKIIYDSIKEAAEKLDIPYYNLRSFLGGYAKNRTSLVYLKNYEEEMSVEIYEGHKNKIKVINTLTNKIYNTIKESALDLDISYGNLLLQLRGVKENTSPIKRYNGQ